jgi:hypothetical protein
MESMGFINKCLIFIQGIYLAKNKSSSFCPGYKKLCISDFADFSVDLSE